MICIFGIIVIICVFLYLNNQHKDFIINNNEKINREKELHLRIQLENSPREEKIDSLINSLIRTHSAYEDLIFREKQESYSLNNKKILTTFNSFTEFFKYRIIIIEEFSTLRFHIKSTNNKTYLTNSYEFKIDDYQNINNDLIINQYRNSIKHTTDS